MFDPAVDVLRAAAKVFEPGDEPAAIGPWIGNARIVLMGEATHGTHEFYRARADLTRYLIEQRGFNVIAVEADWPDAYRVNRWVRGDDTDPSAEAALGDFIRFPRWMWRNHDVVQFLTWLHGFNAGVPASGQVGFYGLDLYSLHHSIDAVLQYLKKVDPASLERARRRYACFDVFGEDTQSYGYATARGLARSCEQEVVTQLVELRHKAAAYVSHDGRLAAEDYFAAEQNARVVTNAEAYYRAMFGSATESWNLRDHHMMSTLEALLGHVIRLSGNARVVVWAHNSHVGDARATQMGRRGEVNIGELVRAKFGGQVCAIGFTTHSGNVTAASNWDEPAALMAVRPSLAGSYERLFHATGLGRFALALNGPASSVLAASRLERAIGVVYRPDSERWSHYFDASLPGQFDVVIHYDETRAVQPLELWSRREIDLPETWPTGV
jgi:erythromycin esterase-like protein